MTEARAQRITQEYAVSAFVLLGFVMGNTVPVLPLFATVIPLGIAAALHPAIIAVQLVLVSQPKGLPRAFAFAIGAAAPMLLFGVLAFAGFSQLPKPAPEEIDIFGVSIWFFVGTLLVIMGIWLLLPHAELAARSAHFLEAHMSHGKPRDFVILGLALNGKSLTSYALLTPALHAVATTSSPVLAGAGLLVLYGLVLLPLWAPLAVFPLIGDRGKDLSGRLSEWVMRNNLRMLGVVALAAGVFLVFGTIVGVGRSVLSSFGT